MRMTPSRKSPFALCTGMILLLVASSATVTLAQDESRKELSAVEIIQKSKEVYAALSAYSDEGKVVYTKEGAPEATSAFSVRLSRPNLYRIEWRCSNSCPAGPEPAPQKLEAWTLWSAGNGQFVNSVAGAQSRTYQEKATTPLDPYTDEDAITITHLFFKHLANVYSRPAYNRQPDGKIGEVDCYVVLEGVPQTEEKTTLWIGKQDFLIRRVRRIGSFESKQADSLVIKRQNTTSTETHANIVLNQKFAEADFVPTIQ
jgi:hypothetical protein